VRRKGCLVTLAILLLLAAVLSLWFLSSLAGTVPPEAEGLLVYVSDRSGIDSLWARRLPHGAPRQLTHNLDPIRSPALSPDGTQVAFSERGRIGVLNVASGVVRPLTLGVDHEDSAPSWRPDGNALVVSALRRSTGRTSLDVLDLEAKDPGAIRTPVTSGSGSDDTAPLFAPDGQSVVFVREETLHRVSLVDGRTVRITGGFRTWRTPRYLASGRLVAQWTQAKQFGLAVMDADGKNLEILWQGAIRYRGLAPSPDDRYVAASYGYDLQFHLTEALGLRHDGEIRLLDRSGLFVARLAGGLRERAHSADWGPARSPAGTPPQAR
jgi:Tol biopolymer transport system component